MSNKEIQKANPAVAAPSAETSRISTHWDGCGSEGGPRHYECLLREHEQLKRELAEWQGRAERAESAALSTSLNSIQSATQPTADAKDAARYRFCLEHGFPVRNQTASSEHVRWTIDGKWFGHNCEVVIDNAMGTKEETCPKCYGYGPEKDCPACHGTGYVSVKTLAAVGGNAK